MTWFMLAMITYPEKQKKCQEELDAIVGRSRIPTFNDLDNLPYLKATVRELLRWRGVAPFGEPVRDIFPVVFNSWLKGIPHVTKTVHLASLCEC
jgi:cytochrome P450